MSGGVLVMGDAMEPPLRPGSPCPRCGGPLAREPLDPALVCLECHRQYWLVPVEPVRPKQARTAPEGDVRMSCVVCGEPLEHRQVGPVNKIYCSRRCNNAAQQARNPG